ncbi:MAG: phosphatidylglycerol lysyltransferase domain-containing protein [Oscillospiraceae bacterium]
MTYNAHNENSNKPCCSLKCLEFKHIDKDDFAILPPFYAAQCFKTCDYSFGVNFMWRDYNYSEYAICDNVLYIKNHDFNGKFSFFFPVCQTFAGDKNCLDTLYEQNNEYLPKNKLITALKNIENFCRENKTSVVYRSVPEKAAKFLEKFYEKDENEYEISVIKSADWYDYLYNAEDLITYSGKKFSGQRNHINKFIKTYGEYKFHPLTNENKNIVVDFIDYFIVKAKEDGTANKMFFFEAQKSKEIFTYFNEIGQVGGFVTINENGKEKIVATALGEVVRDTLFVHIEKALKECNGAYQIIAKELPKYCKEQLKMKFDYINREEDMGIEGLRKSKLSYNPIDFLYKYTIEIKFKD